jgi:hypothetical protein
MGLQNPPAFPAGAELRLWCTHSIAEGKVNICHEGEYYKKELILSLSLKFKNFELVQKIFVKILKGFLLLNYKMHQHL